MHGLQHQYLSAMGIQVWQLRTDSPATVEAVDIDALLPALPETEADKPCSDSEQHVPASETDDVQSLSAAVPPSTSDAAGHADIPEFRLASLIVSEDVMVVTEVQKNAADAFDAQALRLLANTLYAQGVQMAADPVTTFFNWPMLRSPNFDQSEVAACHGCRAFINGQQARHETKWVLLLGELVGQYALSNSKGDGSSSADDSHFILTYSLADIIENPALKSDVWKHFEPMRLSLAVHQA